MNLPTLFVLLLVAAALFFALRAYLRGRGRGACGCGSDRSEPASGCSGCSQSSGCPYCRK